MVLRRQRQVDICDLETSLVYIVSSRAARAIVETLSLKKKKKKPCIQCYLSGMRGHLG